MCDEIWLPVSGYEEFYQVSNLGRVRSLDRMVRSGGGWLKPVKGSIKKPNKAREGYLSVHLYKNQKMKKMYVHRLVAIAFLPNAENHPQVNHKDGNKENNRLDNLEWCSASQNCQHAVDENLYENAKGEDCGNAKLTNEQVLYIRYAASNGVSRKKLASDFGVIRQTIDKIVLRQRWKHI